MNRNKLGESLYYQIIGSREVIKIWTDNNERRCFVIGGDNTAIKHGAHKLIFSYLTDFSYKENSDFSIEKGKI